MRQLLPLLACCAVSGCVGNPFAEESQGVGSRTLEPWGAMQQGGKLYARDGSPVPNEASGALTTSDGVARELSQDDGSRPYLLELYQTAVDQKERLELELSALEQALEEVEQQRQREQLERDALQLNIAGLQAEISRLEQQNMELAGRLVTAQIRRLEAEKLLLETTLEWSRFQHTRKEADTDLETSASSASFVEENKQ